MTFVLVIVLALIGVCVGSFLNVVIHRVPLGESIIHPPSHCPTCDTEIKPWHNVPVLSWVLLRGRCAYCRSPISLRYPLVESATGALFALMTWHFGVTVELPAYLYLSAIAIALTMIDIDVRRLPNSIVLPSYVVGLALLSLAAAANHDGAPVLRAVVSMAALFAFYFVIVFAYPKGMGFGDVKLAGVLGLFLGAISWSAVLIAGFGAFFLGSLYGIALLARRAADRKSAIPFGPFMLSAAVLALFVATPIANWYGSLIGYG